VTDEQSPYHGKWSGKGAHTWETLQTIVKADGYEILEVRENPVSGVRMVTVERVGKDLKSGSQVRGKTRPKGIYPKQLTRDQIDTAAAKAFADAQQNGKSGGDPQFEPPKMHNGKQLDGSFAANVMVGDPAVKIRIMGWWKPGANGKPEITSHAPEADKTWPVVPKEKY
jgi:hypothetical protein